MKRAVRTLVVAFMSAGLVSSTAIAVTPTAAPRAAVPGGAVAARSAPVDNALRVGTYNVCKASCGKGRFSWASRRIALLNAVRTASPDVLAVQEANTALWQGVKHVEDVRQVLSGAGLVIASTNYDNCTSWCTRGAHVFFNPNRVRIASLPNPAVAVGMAGLSAIAQVDFGGIQDRAASWAFLTPIGSNRTTLFVSVHLPTQKTAHAESLRVAVANRLVPWAQALVQQSGLSRADLVIGGDFNSYAKRQPNGAQQVLTNWGLADGFNAAEKVNANYSTVNYTPKTKKYKGFPPRPYWYKANTTRIDYIFSTAWPLRHEVVLPLTADGRFDDAYRASDHNLVMVDLPLR